MREPPRAGQRAGEPVATAGRDDATLVRAALDGDRDAFNELYRHHREQVARTACVLTRDAHLAQDAAQEAFLVGWRDLGRLRNPALFRSWVTGIAVNLCRRRAGGFRILPGPRPAPAPEPEDSAADPPDSATEVTVRAAIATLPRSMREVVVLRFYADFTEAEIAGALGIPVGTVKSRVARARARLTAALGEGETT
jgi:RNA polymerase sigma factor (sigma-70 family)